MNRKTQRKTCIAVTALVVLGLLAWWTNRPVKVQPLPQVYFFDLGTNTLYIQPPGTQAPAKAPSGQMGVMAAVFSCGSCDDAQNRFVGYLVMNSPSYNQALEDGQEITAEISQAGTLYRELQGSTWFTRESPAGMQLIQNLQERCPQGMLSSCTP